MTRRVLFRSAVIRGPKCRLALPEPSRVGWSSDGIYPGLNMITPLMGQDVYLTDHGTIYRCMRIKDDVDFSAGGIQEIDADGTVLWEHRMADAERHHHHDIEILPNGNILMLAWVKKTREEAIARGRDPELLRGEEFWPDSIFELKPLPEGGEIVWEWPCDLVDELSEGEHGPVKANSLFRVTRLPFDHPGLEALRAKGVELPRGPAAAGD